MLRLDLRARKLLWQRGLHRRRSSLQEQHMQRRVPVEHRLHGEPVLQPHDGAVRDVRVHEQCAVRGRAAMLQRLVHLVEHMLHRRAMRGGQMLSGEHLCSVLQVERGLRGQPVLQHGDRAVLDRLPMLDRLAVPDRAVLQHGQRELLRLLQEQEYVRRSLR
jgi:hypothetical protein